MGFWDFFKRPARTPDPAVQPTPPAVTVTMARHTEVERPPSKYLASNRWDELLVLRPDGMPPFRLVKHYAELWLAEETTGLLVNVGNRKLRALGLWTGKVRGGRYAAPITIGMRAQFTFAREPGNEHDRNAIAIVEQGRRVGYVNKQMAAGLAKVIDDGAELKVVSLGGTRWLAATPEVVDWLLGREPG